MTIKAATAASLALGALLLRPPSGLAATELAQSPAPARSIARFAIVIGNNQAETEDVPSLRYADDDAVATHQLLTEAGVDSWLLTRLDADSRRLHPDLALGGAPRRDDFDRALAMLSARMRARLALGDEVDLFIFYSGHGDVDQGEGYVVLEDRRLTRADLYSVLTNSPATRNHVFIDACKSYFLAFDKAAGGRRAPFTGTLAPELVPARLANTGFVLSTSSGRDSHEWERYQAGILSHEVRSALRGAADADGNGGVTYAELGAFLASANSTITNARYRPDVMVRPPAGGPRREVLRWRAVTGPTVVRVKAGAVGHFYVETARGERLLDAHPAPGQALRLHVPAERPLFVRRDDESAEKIVTEAEVLPVTDLAPIKREVAMRGALHLALAQLFTASFGPIDVDTFERRTGDGDPIAALASAPPSREPHRMVRLVSGSLVVAGAAAGLATGALALQRYESGAGQSQAQIAGLNRSVQRLDTASLVCFGVATVAGAAWLGARWTARTTPIVEPLAGAGMTVGLRGDY